MKSTISFPKFDAELDTNVCDPHTNANLTLTLRLGFRQVNPAGGAAEGTHHDYGDPTEPTRKIIKWSAGSWNAWKNNFVSSAQRFWNGKFWLVNSSQRFTFTRRSTTYVPNIYCRVRLKAQEATAANNHHTIDVVRLHRTENWFGSHATLYDSLDTRSTEKATDSAGNPIMQRAHVHEVGHLFGLEHVDVGKAHCPNGPTDDTNLRACYGVSDHDMNSVMGSGMQLRTGHAAPWQTVMPAFALADAQSLPAPVAMFNILTEVWEAKTTRHYPRTVEEAAAGTHITRPVAR